MSLLGHLPTVDFLGHASQHRLAKRTWQSSCAAHERRGFLSVIVNVIYSGLSLPPQHSSIRFQLPPQTQNQQLLGASSVLRWLGGAVGSRGLLGLSGPGWVIMALSSPFWGLIGPPLTPHPLGTQDISYTCVPFLLSLLSMEVFISSSSPFL